MFDFSSTASILTRISPFFTFWASSTITFSTYPANLVESLMLLSESTCDKKETEFLNVPCFAFTTSILTCAVLGSASLTTSSFRFSSKPFPFIPKTTTANTTSTVIIIFLFFIHLLLFPIDTLNNIYSFDSYNDFQSSLHVQAVFETLQEKDHSMLKHHFCNVPLLSFHFFY